MSKETVLSLLLEHSNQYLSGQSMSRTLGISRAAVWKAVCALREEGYTIISAPRRGYRLAGAPDRLSCLSVSPELHEHRIGSQLCCLDCIDSTNTEAKRRALQGAMEGLVILSEEQTGGRGRAGRSFHSPPGCGLYLSVLLRPKLPPQDVVNFTAWAAVAVCDGIEAVCGIRPKIKWTNDIVLNGKKLCGILTELGVESESGLLEYLVVGIGINVNHRPEDFPEELQSVATSLFQELGQTVRRSELAKEILLALDRMYESFPQEKMQYLSTYRADCLTPGNPVRLITPANTRDAYAVGIDEEFRLLVEYPNGERAAVSTGEVSVRGMYGYV